MQLVTQELLGFWRLPVIDDPPRSAASAPADVLGLAVVAHEASVPMLRDRVVHVVPELAAVVFRQDDLLVPRE